MKQRMTCLQLISASGGLLLLAGGLSSCAPTIRLDTPEPVRIDVNMKVEVVQTNAPVAANAAGASASDSPKEKSARQKQRERMAEVQTLKNDRVIGEASNGLLQIANPPVKKEYADYAAKVVAEENADRQTIFAEEAKQESSANNPVTPDTVALQYAARRTQGAFPGELVQGPDGKWVPR